MALSVNGARELHALILHSKLRAQLEDHTETLGCCYVKPPIGSYEEHVSSREPSVGLRKNGFREKWNRQGARLPAREKLWLVRSRLKRQDPIRWATDVDQATAPKTEYARADVIIKCRRNRDTTLWIGLQSGRLLSNRQTRPCTVCWSPADGARIKENGLGLRRAAKEE